MEVVCILSSGMENNFEFFHLYYIKNSLIKQLLAV